MSPIDLSRLFDDKVAVEPQPLQTAIVAFCSVTTDVVILAASPDLIREIVEGMIGAGDVFEHGQGDNPDHGIWAWEGRIQEVRHLATPDHPEEYDMEFKGKWRELTDDEWSKLRQGQERK